MADAFNDREKGFEAKHQLDQQQQFKAEMRRNRLLGEWLADQHFGLTGDAREDYTKEVVMSDLEEPGVEDVVRKVLADIEKYGAGISEADLRAKIAEIDGIAAQQVREEG